MSRKPPPPARSKPTNSRPKAVAGPTLAGLRAEIDRIDKDLLAHLNKRAEIALKIGQVKTAQGLEVWSSAREDEVVAKVLAANKGPLPDDTIRLIFRELMGGSRRLQRSLRVAYLGPRYSYSHLAALAKFGESVEHVPVGTIAAVFEELNRRHVDFGIVPLENSTDGRIADTLDMFTRLPAIKIRAEVRLRIHHCLLGRGEWGEIQRVYSKAQALSQCRHWLSKNLPQARLIEVVSTAHAADLASREEHAAAVASRAAAEVYKLKPLAEDIEDQQHNLTRFAVIGEKIEDRTGRDKTSLMIRLPNTAGSLARAIAPFEKNGVNMTWIESFPAGDSPTDKDPNYIFFLDVEGHVNDAAVQRALDAVKRKCEAVDILGSYPRSVAVET